MVFELQFLDWLQTLQTPILNEIMKAVTHLGDAGALWIILAAVLLAFPKTRKSGAIVAAALIVDLVLCNGILKNIFARTRPFDVKDYTFFISNKTIYIRIISISIYAFSTIVFSNNLNISCVSLIACNNILRIDTNDISKNFMGSVS